MKTTVDISDALFREIKKQSVKKGMTFREMVEAALRLFLKAEEKAKGPFRLRKHPFKGKGLAQGLSEDDWTVIRDRAYEGRGS